MAHDWSGNAASNGYYVELYTGTTRQLQTGYGFSFTAFDNAVPVTVYTPTALTATAINAAITAANAAGGGIVRLPAGEANLTTAIVAKSNVMIEGAGAGQTVLTYTGATSGRCATINDVQNVVLRDMTLDANRLGRFGVLVENATNVLIERCAILGPSSRENGISGRYMNNVTVRYCTIDAFNRHGFAVKDCYEDEGVTAGTSAFCSAQYASAGGTYGAEWTTNVAFYSNTVSGSGVHGINYHGLNAEICGNMIVDNTHAGKFFDGRNIQYHHNRIDGNTYGIMFNFTLDIASHVTGNIILRCNSFGDNTERDLYFGDQYGIGYDAITLDSNTYENGVILGLGNIDQADLLVCSGSDDETYIDSGERTTADADACLGCGDAATPATLTEHIRNGDFADDADWVLTTDGTITATFSDTTNDVVLDITSGGTASTFSQSAISITNTTQYRLTFTAVADSSSSLPVTLTDSTGVTNRGLNKTFIIGTTEATYATIFAATATDASAMLNFVLTSLSSVEITIDDVSLVSVSSGIDVDFEADVTTGTTPLSVQFTDLTIAIETISSRSWADDGSEFATTQNPNPSLTTGSHTIALTVTTASYSGTETKAAYVVVSPAGGGATDVTQYLAVASSTDDVERRVAGYDATLAGLRTYNKVGLRFVLDSAIPSGATVDAATLEVYSEGSSGLPISHTIRLEDVSDAGTFLGASDFDTRDDTQTTANTAWNVAAWTAATWYEIADLLDEVQELVDTYGGLAAGSGIVVFITNDTGSGYVKFKAFDGGASTAPKLTIQHSTATTSVHQTAIGTRAGVGIGL